MTDKLNIGDIIRDTEDGDCYFEGTVTELNAFGGVKTYQVTRVIWSAVDHKDDEYIGQVIEPK